MIVQQARVRLGVAEHDRHALERHSLADRIDDAAHDRPHLVVGIRGGAHGGSDGRDDAGMLEIDRPAQSLDTRDHFRVGLRRTRERRDHDQVGALGERAQQPGHRCRRALRQVIHRVCRARGRARRLRSPRRTRRGMRSCSSYHAAASRSLTTRWMRTTSRAPLAAARRAGRARRRRDRTAPRPRRRAPLRLPGGWPPTRTSRPRSRARGARPPRPRAAKPAGASWPPARGAASSSARRDAVRKLTPISPEPTSDTGPSVARRQQPAHRHAHRVSGHDNRHRREWRLLFRAAISPRSASLAARP